MTAPTAPATPASNEGTVLVTADTFIRAETDTYFADAGERSGGLGIVNHYREPTAIDNQTVVRTNHDTLYSSAVVDLAAGPVTVTLPDPGERFMSMIVINEDHYAFSGSFEAPNWDPGSQKTVRDALLVLNSTLPDLRHAFGRKEDVDPVRHLIATAAAWGGNPDQDAIYLNVTPAQSDGNTTYRLTVPAEVPADGFWSITVYGADGYIAPNDLGVYSLNSLSAQKSDDGTVAIQFGGCDDQIPNCLPTPPGWNYMVRFYRPRQEIVNGAWTFPDAVPVD